MGSKNKHQPRKAVVSGNAAQAMIDALKQEVADLHKRPDDQAVKVTINKVLTSEDPDRFVSETLAAASPPVTRAMTPREAAAELDSYAWQALARLESGESIQAADVGAWVGATASEFEAWQYLGVEEGCWVFRHRHHPTTRRREYRRIPVQ